MEYANRNTLLIRALSKIPEKEFNALQFEALTNKSKLLLTDTSDYDADDLDQHKAQIEDAIRQYEVIETVYFGKYPAAIKDPKDEFY